MEDLAGKQPVICGVQNWAQESDYRNSTHAEFEIWVGNYAQNTCWFTLCFCFMIIFFVSRAQQIILRYLNALNIEIDCD